MLSDWSIRRKPDTVSEHWKNCVVENAAKQQNFPMPTEYPSDVKRDSQQMRQRLIVGWFCERPRLPALQSPRGTIVSCRTSILLASHTRNRHAKASEEDRASPWPTNRCQTRFSTHADRRREPCVSHHPRASSRMGTPRSMMCMGRPVRSGMATCVPMPRWWYTVAATSCGSSGRSTTYSPRALDWPMI